jgi:hypothetical protein
LVHPPGLLEGLLDRLRGRHQLLVRAGAELPLLLLSYPRGRLEIAQEIEAACLRTLGTLRREIVETYAPVMAGLPALVVVVLRPRNPCGCLGHHHPRGAESRLSRRIESDLGRPVGEIDLAYEAIREWRPQPLSAMAAEGLGARLPSLHFRAAVLAVLLHELEHLAFPERPEQEIRSRSNSFYGSVMEDLVAGESGERYGMAAPPRP